MYQNVYFSKELIPKQRGEYGKEISMTIPGKETTIEEALRRYRSDGMTQVKMYYEKEGVELPQFEKMDRIEQLMLLREVRQSVINKEAESKKKYEKAERAKEHARKVSDDEQRMGQSKKQDTK